MRVMMICRQPAHTTPELLLTCTLLAVLAAFAVPSLVRARDALSVRAARDAIVTAATRTRSLAMARGGAFLRVNEDGVIAVLARDTARVHSQWDLGQRYGIRIEIEHSSRTSALLEYDALGVGRLANLTVRVQRGQTAGTVTFSAYGRPRTW